MAFNHQKYQPFHPIQKTDRQWPDKQITQAPKWCAVDLRDGNQALMEPMNVDQKVALFKLLVKCGFKEIEVGFPAASQPDFDFVRKIINENMIPHDVSIQALTQAREPLVEKTFEALSGAKKAVVHVYNSTSPVQRDQVFGLDKAGIKAIAVAGATMVKNISHKYPGTQWNFEYSPESFSATEPEFALDVCNAVLDVWQPSQSQRAIINLPATVECTTPNVFADQVEFIHERIRYREWIDISVHTHNDRGCAVAAAELAVMAGADRVEGTLLGNGERTGNMDIVIMAMNLYAQGINPELHLADMDEIIRTVKECTNIPIHPRHPWAGELVFTAFSGSHQDAINKCLQQQETAAPWKVAYLPIDPKDLGRSYQEIIRINVVIFLSRLRVSRCFRCPLGGVIRVGSGELGNESYALGFRRAGNPVLNRDWRPDFRDRKIGACEGTRCIPSLHLSEYGLNRCRLATIFRSKGFLFVAHLKDG